MIVIGFSSKCNSQASTANELLFNLAASIFVQCIKLLKHLHIDSVFRRKQMKKFTFEGKAIASLAGGTCWDTFGSRRSLLGCGIANLTFGLIYVALHVLWLRKLDVKSERVVRIYARIYDYSYQKIILKRFVLKIAAKLTFFFIHFDTFLQSRIHPCPTRSDVRK